MSQTTTKSIAETTGVYSNMGPAILRFEEDAPFSGSDSVSPQLQKIADEIVAGIRAKRPDAYIITDAPIGSTPKPHLEAPLAWHQRLWAFLKLDIRDVWKLIKMKLGGRNA